MNKYYSESIEKFDIKALASYLLYSTGAGDIESLQNAHEKIENTFDILFDKLEESFPMASRDNDDLLNIIIDFAKVHDEIYFQMGLVMGFQLYKNMEQWYPMIDEKMLRSIIEKV